MRFGRVSRDSEEASGKAHACKLDTLLSYPFYLRDSVMGTITVSGTTD